MYLIDEARRIAYEELGHDRVNAGETAESYVNGMTNWEFLEFLTRLCCRQEAFLAIPDKYGITHNAVLVLFGH